MIEPASIKITSQHWHLKIGSLDRNPLGNVSGEIELSRLIRDLIKRELNGFVTTDPTVEVAPLRTWTFGLVGGGSGSLTVAVGLQDAWVQLTFNHETLSAEESGRRLSGFKRSLVAIFESPEVVSDDASIEFDIVAGDRTERLHQQEATSDRIMEGLTGGGNP